MDESGYLELEAWGHGLATITRPHPDGDYEPPMLDVWYPRPALGDPQQTHPPVGFEAPSIITEAVRADPVRGVETVVVFTAAALNRPPVDVPDAYLRLHLLSHRLVKPGMVNLEGLLDILPTVVWTSAGPVPPRGFEQTLFRLRTEHGQPVVVNGVGQIPRMVDYVLPGDVHIADTNKVRLGAHLAPGTVVSHTGFVEHDAGTLEAARVDRHLAAGEFMAAGA